VCHLGTASCFGDEPVSRAQRLAFLGVLEQVIARRLREQPEGSYTARLAGQGVLRVAQKVGEEGLELALAGAAQADDKVIGEAADLLYHLLVLLQVRQIPLERVLLELQGRHQAKP
jgi:phosphoribosyl-AMP cyclohydrolase / phosphoribosyl-ATP pyrophosphohydrolase